MSAKPSTRYGFEDMVALTLQVAKDMDTHEPSTYKEVVTGDKSNKWLSTMGEESHFIRIRHEISHMA